MLLRELLGLLRCCWPSLLLHCALHPLWGSVQVGPRCWHGKGPGGGSRQSPRADPRRGRAVGCAAGAPEAGEAAAGLDAVPPVPAMRDRARRAAAPGFREPAGDSALRPEPGGAGLLSDHRLGQRLALGMEEAAEGGAHGAQLRRAGGGRGWPWGFNDGGESGVLRAKAAF